MAPPAAAAATSRPASRRRRGSLSLARPLALFALLAAVPAALAQSCITLSGSSACPAFNSSSISLTDDSVTDSYPFLKYVKDTDSFDQHLLSYVQNSYVDYKFKSLLGCNNVDLANTSELYARYTTTVICNAIIQKSLSPCGASAKPLCADSCAEYGESETMLVGDTDICNTSSSNLSAQIRADFVNCASAAESLSGAACIKGSDNEEDNCGFGNSTVGLCGYCSSGGQNSTDTCCYNSNVESRCSGVSLPSITDLNSFMPADSSKGLSGGAKAGIVVGSVVGAAFLAGLAFLLLLLRRRQNTINKGNVLNQPTPPRKGPAMSTASGPEVLPGGRIARMSALEGPVDDSPAGSSAFSGVGVATAGASARRGGSSSEFGSSVRSARRGSTLVPPTAARRNGSASSRSVLRDGVTTPTSGSGNEFSSPQAMASQQSEQLSYFKDYYSQDDIHPGDRVATLWAYQPRAGDEFLLERGHMLKVVGIWDDGWATGVMLDERAEDWEEKKNGQRDSGVSHTSGHRDRSPPGSGEIKAFPLVCVCLPQHWRQTLDGGSGEAESSGGSPP